MVKTTLLLEEEAAKALHQLATSQGKREEDIIRGALAIYAPEVSRPLPKGIGAYRSGRSDISERAEELLLDERDFRAVVSKGGRPFHLLPTDGLQ